MSLSLSFVYYDKNHYICSMPLSVNSIERILFHVNGKKKEEDLQCPPYGFSFVKIGKSLCFYSNSKWIEIQRLKLKKSKKDSNGNFNYPTSDTPANNSNISPPDYLEDLIYCCCLQIDNHSSNEKRPPFTFPQIFEYFLKVHSFLFEEGILSSNIPPSIQTNKFLLKSEENKNENSPQETNLKYENQSKSLFKIQFNFNKSILFEEQIQNKIRKKQLRWQIIFFFFVAFFIYYLFYAFIMGEKGQKDLIQWIQSKFTKHKN